ncbi:MAG: sugar phosphate isomerase/epimerase family protein [Reyranella sp.]
MTLPRLALSVIGDEISPSLEEMISFAHEHGLKRLDMRTVDGRNLLGMKKEEIIKISRALEKAGLTVPTFVSPLFKWPAAGKSTGAGKVDFAFDPKECPAEDIIDHAIEIAVILGAPHMRIFSYLRHRRFRPGDLTSGKAFTKLMSLAGHYDISIQLENEPVCNIGNIAELRAFFDPKEEELVEEELAVEELEEDMLALETIDGVMVEEKVEVEVEVKEEEEELVDPRDKDKEVVIYLRPLVDIANAWATGERPSDDDIASLAPLVTAIHLKDRDLAANRTVPLGDGDVPWPAELKRLLAGVTAEEVLASIETHCPQDSRNATARSIAGLRRIAAEIGVEIV